jgi:hypothetical protein
VELKLFRNDRLICRSWFAPDAINIRRGRRWLSDALDILRFNLFSKRCNDFKVMRQYYFKV